MNPNALLSDAAREMLKAAGVTRLCFSSSSDRRAFYCYRPAPINPEMWGFAVLLDYADRPEGPFLGPFILADVREEAVAFEAEATVAA